VNQQPNFRVEFRAQPSEVPAIVRIRRLLKYAGRVLGLVCVDLAEIPSAASPPLPLAENPPGRPEPLPEGDRPV
jgi:hypothetical protein